MASIEYESPSFHYFGAGSLLDVTTAFIVRNLDAAHKHAIKAVYHRMKGRIIHLLASYTPEQLEKALRGLGISRGDAVMMHSSFNSFTGFQGGPKDVIDRLINVVGPQGHVFMMSLAYTSSSYDYVLAGNPFDVRKTWSRMGIISETFRRRKHVLRSANPLHPVLAWGPRAPWVVSGHDQLLYSCGPGSPFEKMLELDTKLLFLMSGSNTAPSNTISKIRFKESAPFPIYCSDPLEATLIDEEGKTKSMKNICF